VERGAAMRVWVTGAAGFVGRRLCARLRETGAEVIASDRELDVADPARVRRALREARPDAIAHLAAIALVPEAEADPARAFRVNYGGAHAVLSGAAAEVPRARVLLVTSAAVYGAAAPGAAGFSEHDELRPVSSYARGKAAADLLGARYAAEGLYVVRARPFNHTGAGRPAAFVESRLARDVVRIAAGTAPARLALSNADSQRDFLHADDVVAAYLALLAPGVAAGAYNIASGIHISLRTLAQRLCALASVAPEIAETRDPLRPPDASFGSAARLMRATGWRPQRSLDATLRELLDDWRTRALNDAPA
jgi:GDP-4-dehydro-6-deoxy-D-mannose reductase